jgi:tetratricopeptide (TPR) repeat protein
MLIRSLVFAMALACPALLCAEDSSAQHWVQAGTSLYSQGSLAAAQDAFNKAIAMDPANAAAYQGLGSCLLKQGQQEQAIAALKKSVELDPSNKGLADWLATVSAQAQAPAAAAAAQSPASEAPAAPPMPQDATPAPLAPPAVTPPPAPAPMAAPSAVTQNAAAAPAPSFPAASPMDSLLAEADGLLSQGKAQDAETAYRGLLYLGPGPAHQAVAARAYEGLGQALYQQGRYDEAGQALLSSLALEPQNPVVLSFLLSHPELGARQDLPGPRDRWAPLWRSAILPGWGQAYNGEPEKGLALGAITLGCLAGTAYSYLQAQSAYGEYSSLGSNSSRAQFDDAYGRTQDWGTANHVLYALFGAFYAYTLVDAALDAKPLLEPALSLSRGGALMAGLKANY